MTVDSLDYQTLLEQSIEELRLKTAAHDGIWQLGECSWNVDQDMGTIVFTSPNGMIATCSMQIIGTYNTLDNTWLWAWDHPSVVSALQDHAWKVREYGETNSIDLLTTRKLNCSQTQAWEFTAVACKLCNAQGGYRGPAGTTLVFMTFDNVSLNGSSS
jgi:hypothetical protein